MQYSVVDLIGDKLEAIWQMSEYHDLHGGIAPYIPCSLQTDGLLFIGLNPSEDERNQVKGSKPLVLDEKHRYYAKFPEIAESVGLENRWSHIDLLFFRQTKQKKVENLCKLKDSAERNFIWDQLALAKILIDKAAPKVMVVNNSLARTLLGFDGTWLNMSFLFDNRVGTHFNNNTPVFFTSMLTGQRALDRGSLERLKWHIRFALESIE